MSDCQWYYSVSGKQEGPVPEERLLQMFETGLLPADTIVWTPGFADWTPASSVALFSPVLRNTPPPMTVRQEAIGHAPLYAGFWKRVAASVLDSMILMGAGFVIGFMLGFILMTTTGTVEGAEMMGNIIGVTMGWLYSALLESSPRQATLGKMALGIKVTDLSGNPISFGRASGRHFGKIISMLILFIGFVMAAFTERKQCLHDMMAGCLVVNR